MSANDDMLYSKNLFLLTFKGRMTVHFMDGQTLEGEFVAQDELNIFLTIDHEPIMVPRYQIRYIKGQPGQSIEADSSQEIFAGLKSAPVMPTETAPAAAQVVTPAADEADDLSTLILEPSIDLPPYPPAAETEDGEGRTLILETETPTPTAPPTAETGLETIIFKPEPAPDRVEETGDEGTMFLSQDMEITPPGTKIEEAVAQGEVVLKPEAKEQSETTILIEEPQVEQVSGQLICTTGPHLGDVFKFIQGDMTIGRSMDNTVPLPKDKEISRRHAIIIQEGDKFVIRDRGSLNGTFVNDKPIEISHQLKDGDIILVGVSTLKYQEK